MTMQEFKAVLNTSAERNQVTVTLKSMICRARPGWIVLIPEETITNNSSEPIMRVRFLCRMHFPDSDKTETVSREWYGEETAVAPGNTITAKIPGFQLPHEMKPDRVSIEITEISTVSQLPPVRLPKAGDYLYQAMNDQRLAGIAEKPPVRITRVIDRMGMQTRTEFTAGKQLEEAVRAFMKIRISAKPGMFVTDNYNRIIFTWEDGSETVIRLLLKNLDYTVTGITHIYALENYEEFFRLNADFGAMRGRF